MSKLRKYISEGRYEEVNAIEIPESATNGDMIKAMFPHSKVIFVLSNVPKTDVIKIENEAFLVERSWWNAPYKAESEESEDKK